MEQKVEINKSDYAVDFLARFDLFRRSNKHCDFTIRAGDKEMSVHRIVLATSSEYFDAMLSHDTKEKNEGVVDIKQADPDCVVKCVDFMYTGEASISEEKQTDLLHVAHMLRLNRLYNRIAALFENKLDCSSFFSTRNIATMYNCYDLVKVCDEFAVKNFRSIAKSDDFKQLDVEYVKFLLSSDELKDGETIKCKALMMWVNYDSERAASLFQLLKCVDFTKVPMTYRKFLTENEQAITNSNDCLKYVVKSVFGKTKAVDVTLDGARGILILDSISKRMKCFDVKEQTWNDMQEIPPRAVDNSCAVVHADEYIYVFTVNKYSYRLRYVDPYAGWEQIARRSGNWGPVVVLNDMIYSTDYNNFTNKIEQYNINRDRWMFISNRSITCLGSAIAVFQENVFLIGGLEESSYLSLNSVQKYDPMTSTWADAPTLRKARHNAAASTLNQSIYLFGGRCTGHNDFVDYEEDEYYQESVEILHSDSNLWHLVELPGFSRQFLTSVTFDDKIYLVGNNGSEFHSVDEYVGSTSTLRTTCSLTGMSLPIFSASCIM